MSENWKTRDRDIDHLYREDLKDALQAARNRIKVLEDAIRADHAARSHALCWYRPELWSLVPGLEGANREVPPKDEFTAFCAIFNDSLDPLREAAAAEQTGERPPHPQTSPHNHADPHST